MALASGGNTQLMERMAGGNAQAASQRQDIKALLSSVSIKKRFEELLGKKAPGFMSSIISVTNGNAQLQSADPRTIIAAAAVAAALDLPIDPNLGFAYIVPYNVKKDGVKQVQAQFQLGYKGYIQLAMRTSQYKTINATEVYEGEIKSINRFTGEIEFGERTSDKIVGYIAYFKLLNGFEKYLYMSKEEVEKHGKAYSKSYGNEYGRWAQDFFAMAIKTVIKRLLSKYGILSIEMQSNLGTALVADEAVVTESGEYHHVDAIETEGRIVDEDTGEISPESGEAAPYGNAETSPSVLKDEKAEPAESVLEQHRRITRILKS